MHVLYLIECHHYCVWYTPFLLTCSVFVCLIFAFDKLIIYFCGIPKEKWYWGLCKVTRYDFTISNNISSNTITLHNLFIPAIRTLINNSNWVYKNIAAGVCRFRSFSFTDWIPHFPVEAHWFHLDPVRCGCRPEYWDCSDAGPSATGKVCRLMPKDTV